VLSAGTVIADRYRIVKVLGEGGMGVVYEAEHAHIGKRVALKLLNQEFSKNTEAIERFQQEAKIAGTIGHLNICEVMDFGVTEDGLPYLVMEFLEGESLADILEREVKLPVDVAMGIIYQILDGLEEVHAKGILHRDLKPENVFITNVKGHGLVVKLLDFGISKIMKPGSESMRLTKTGAMVGTPYYMSPEHIRARSDLDQRADLYSCGVIFYEMITGEVPFKGSGYSQIIAAILEETPPDPKNYIPDLPDDLMAFVWWGMERDPAKRPQTAGEYKARIRELQGGTEGLGSLPMKSKHFART
jgi:serine/threonine protein kinase